MQGWTKTDKQKQTERQTNKQTKLDKTKRELTELNPYHKQNRQIDRQTYDPTKISLSTCFDRQRHSRTEGQTDRKGDKLKMMCAIAAVEQTSYH